MSDFNYRGYTGSVDFQPDACYFYGEVQLKRDVVRYVANNIEQLEKEFHKSLDNYLADCAAMGIEPG